MSDAAVPRPATETKRRVALVLGYTALVALSAIWLFFLLTVTFTEGATRTAAVASIVAFTLTGWLWAVLAVVALVLAAGGARRLHPMLVAGIALAEALLGLLLLLPR